MNQVNQSHVDRVSMNWALDAQSMPFFGRQVFKKEIITKAPRTVNDDTWTFNTQSSSQCKNLLSP